MNSPRFADVLKALIQRDPGIEKKPDGEIHVTRAAEALGINQSTLSRMLDDKSENPSPENSRKLQIYFKVNGGQLVGSEEIPGLFEEGLYQYLFPARQPKRDGVEPPPDDLSLFLDSGLTEEQYYNAVQSIADWADLDHALAFAQFFLERAQALSKGLDKARVSPLQKVFDKDSR